MGNPLLISLRLSASVSVCGSGEWGFQKVLVNHRTLSFRVTAKFSSLKGFRLHRISKGHLSGFFLLRCLNDWRSKLLPVLYFSLPPQPTQLALFQPFYSTGLLSYTGPKPGTLYVFAVFIFNITLKMLLGVNAGEGLLTRPQILKRLYFSLLFPC